MNRTCGLRCQSARSCRHHKGCRFIQTAGRWSWKSKSAKECVTTHLPNGPAPKMDGAQARPPIPNRQRKNITQDCLTSRRAWGPWRSLPPVRAGRTGPSADLGGSSKYSNESHNFEGRSGERFHVNSSWTWVSRS